MGDTSYEVLLVVIQRIYSLGQTFELVQAMGSGGSVSKMCGLCAELRFKNINLAIEYR